MGVWTLVGACLLLAGFLVLSAAAALELRPKRIVTAGRVSGAEGAARRRGRILARWAITMVAVALIVGTVTLSARYVIHPVFLALWYVTAAITVASLCAHAVGRRHLHRPVAEGRVLAVVAAFNEPADNLYACVESLLTQTVPLDVVVVDDGSATPVPGRWKDRVRWVYQPNTGKAGAQCSALRMFGADEYDFVLTVDSDSVLYPDATEHLLRAMSHPDVWAATGWLNVRNHAASLVTMAADIEIGISCVTGRASRSLIGALESTSGALALYRGSLVYDHLEEYAANPRSIDDDRWLTARALRRGQVVAVNEAVVATDMPDTIAGLWRQRVRWSRSWLLSLPFVMRHLGFAAKVSPLVGLFEFLAAPAIVVYAFTTFVLPVFRDDYSPVTGLQLTGYLLALLAARYCQSALYLLERPARSRSARVHAWLFGTLGEIAISVVLLPLARYWAVLSSRRVEWGNRGAPGQHASARVRASALVAQHRYRADDDAAELVETAPGGRHAASNSLTAVMPAFPGAGRRGGMARLLVPGQAARRDGASLRLPGQVVEGVPGQAARHDAAGLKMRGGGSALVVPGQGRGSAAVTPGQAARHDARALQLPGGPAQRDGSNDAPVVIPALTVTQTAAHQLPGEAAQQDGSNDAPEVTPALTVTQTAAHQLPGEAAQHDPSNGMTEVTPALWPPRAAVRHDTSPGLATRRGGASAGPVVTQPGPTAQHDPLGEVTAVMPALWTSHAAGRQDTSAAVPILTPLQRQDGALELHQPPRQTTRHNGSNGRPAQHTAPALQPLGAAAGHDPSNDITEVVPALKRSG
jgi:glycosyltransferase involved in cell wall biosynthesis